MSEQKFMFQCPLCHSDFQHGPHRYEGHVLSQYGRLVVCDSCWMGNHDGWSAGPEAILLQHLKQNSIPIPTRNDKGYLPRD